MKKLTKKQAIVITGYTGKLACDFSDFHADVEKRIGRSVMSHEMASLDMDKLYKTDFIKMCITKEIHKPQLRSKKK